MPVVVITFPNPLRRPLPNSLDGSEGQASGAPVHARDDRSLHSTGTVASAEGLEISISQVQLIF